MKVSITLKEGFLKGYVFQYENIFGVLTIDNGSTLKEFYIYFMPEEQIIEVTHKGSCPNKYSLTKEERLAVIEKILSEYTTISKSIIHATATFYLEQYKLVDTTNIDNDKKDKAILDTSNNKKAKTIFFEYLASNKANESKLLLFRELKEIYSYIERNYLKIEKEDSKIQLSNNLSKFQKNDIKYFTYLMLEKYSRLYDIKLNVNSKECTLEFLHEAETR